MTFVLIRKLLRDVRLALVVVCFLVAGYQCLWAKITERIAGELVPLFSGIVGMNMLKELLRQGPLGHLMETLMGGQNIGIDRAMDMMSIGYVHPLMQVIFCIWAVGRASEPLRGRSIAAPWNSFWLSPCRATAWFWHICTSICSSFP